MAFARSTFILPSGDWNSHTYTTMPSGSRSRARLAAPGSERTESAPTRLRGEGGLEDGPAEEEEEAAVEARSERTSLYLPRGRAMGAAVVVEEEGVEEEGVEEEGVVDGARGWHSGLTASSSSLSSGGGAVGCAFGIGLGTKAG